MKYTLMLFLIINLFYVSDGHTGFLDFMQFNPIKRSVPRYCNHTEIEKAMAEARRLRGTDRAKILHVLTSTDCPISDSLEGNLSETAVLDALKEWIVLCTHEPSVRDRGRFDFRGGAELHALVPEVNGEVPIARVTSEELENAKGGGSILRTLGNLKNRVAASLVNFFQSKPTFDCF